MNQNVIAKKVGLILEEKDKAPILIAGPTHVMDKAGGRFASWVWRVYPLPSIEPVRECRRTFNPLADLSVTTC